MGRVGVGTAGDRRGAEPDDGGPAGATDLVREGERKVVFAGVVRTGADGQATVEVPLPPQTGRLVARWTAVHGLDWRQAQTGLDVQRKASVDEMGAYGFGDFLKILGATGASTAVVGCSSEKVGKLIPYVASPDNTVPGVSQYYASTCRECASACGVTPFTSEIAIIGR